ncbi:MAG: FAD-binding protein, partial [Actinobacteria bacterium]|nr:FAD-binding protein [Actinomycetota bacterium]
LTTKAMLCISNPGNTGDGHKMGVAVGAALSCMGGTMNTPINTQIGRDPSGNLGEAIPGIGINIYGQRFCNEWTTYAYYMYKSYQQDSHNTWIVFDQTVFSMGAAALGVDSGVDSGDDSDAVKAMIESGALVRGETIQELAEKIGVNAAGLEATLAKWNLDMTTSGVDTMFGKSAGLSPINTAPFYAAADLSANLGTLGGLKINADAQVIDWAGEPIARLYAGGMTSGGWVGQWYPESGTAVMGTVHWGRKAGRHAASLEAWA